MENYMLQEVLSFPGLIRQVSDEISENAEKAAEAVDLRKVKNVLLFGSGDSYNAAVCAAQAFRTIARLNASAAVSMEAARYIGPDLTGGQADTFLAVGVSISGEALRGVEAAGVLRSAGCQVVSLTASDTSHIAQNSKEIILANIPAMVPKAPVPVPGLRSFLVSVIGLYHFAIAIGIRRHTIGIEDAERLKHGIAEQADMLEAVFSQRDQKVSEFARLIAEEQRIEVLGSGPCRGAADFMLSKVLEGQGYDIVSQDIEEYAHGSFFRNRPEHLPTVLICPSQSRCCSRAKEILEVLIRQKRPLLILTDERSSYSRIEKAAVVLSTEKKVREELSPLPMASLAAYLSSIIPLSEGDIYMHGHQGAYNEDGLPTIHNGEILTPEEILSLIK